MGVWGEQTNKRNPTPELRSEACLAVETRPGREKGELESPPSLTYGDHHAATATLAPTTGKPSHCLKVCVAAGVRSPVESLTRPSSPKEPVAPFRLAAPGAGCHNRENWVC